MVPQLVRSNEKEIKTREFLINDFMVPTLGSTNNFQL